MSHDNPSTTDRQVNAPDGTPVPYDAHVPSHRESEPIADPVDARAEAAAREGGGAAVRRTHGVR